MQTGLSRQRVSLRTLTKGCLEKNEKNLSQLTRFLTNHYYSRQHLTAGTDCARKLQNTSKCCMPAGLLCVHGISARDICSAVAETILNSTWREKTIGLMGRRAENVHFIFINLRSPEASSNEPRHYFHESSQKKINTSLCLKKRTNFEAKICECHTEICPVQFSITSDLVLWIS